MSAREALEKALADLPSVAAGTVAEDLVGELRRLGDHYGPTGVARVAAELAGATVHPAGELCGVRPGSRRGDPSTSAKAAELALPRARSLAFRLLYFYDVAAADGLTADEAADGLASWEEREPGRQDRRRVSDLLALGLVEPVLEGDGSEVTRPYRGRDQRLLRITDAGRELIEQRRREASS